MLAAPTRFVALTNSFRSSHNIPISISYSFPKGFPQKSVIRASENLRLVAEMSTPAAAVNAGRGSITHVIFDMDGLLLGNFIVFALCLFLIDVVSSETNFLWFVFDSFASIS